MLQGPKNFKVPGRSLKRQKASHTAAQDRPMRIMQWTNRALIFGRCFSFSNFAKAFGVLVWSFGVLIFWSQCVLGMLVSHAACLSPNLLCQRLVYTCSTARTCCRSTRLRSWGVPITVCFGCGMAALVSIYSHSFLSDY